MGRRVLPKPPSEQVLVLSRMLRQFEADPRMGQDRRKRLIEHVASMIAELHKEAALQVTLDERVATAS